MNLSPKIVLKMLNFAAIGAACGFVLASIGSVLGSSPTSVAITIAACALPGIYQRNLVGFILGAISGALLAAFGNLIGGTTLGVVMTISACSLLGAICCWADDRDTASKTSITPQPAAHAEMYRASERSTNGKYLSYGITIFWSLGRWFKAWLLESYDCGQWIDRNRQESMA